MAYAEQKMIIATCDAASCSKTSQAPGGESIPGFHVSVSVVDSVGDQYEVEAFAHSEAHIGPAARAVLARHRDEHASDEGESPVVEDGPLLPTGAGADDADELLDEPAPAAR